MSEVRKLKIRKNLNRWSRKLLVCIGLENIGKHLVGEDKWQSTYPAWRDSEQDATGDFDPSEVAEQDIASADLSHNDPSDSPDEETNDEKNECLDNFLHLLPYWYFVNRAFGNHAGGGLGPGNPSDEDLSATTPNSILEAFDAQRLNSLLLLETLKQQIQLQSGNSQLFENPFSQVQNLSLLSSDAFEAVKKLSSANLTPNNCLPLTLPDLTINIADNDDQEENDQPLDLTQKNKGFDGGMKSQKAWPLMDSGEVSSSSLRGMKVAESRVSKIAPRPNQRAGRGYTTQELEAALRDIQSGKLGTRRAAVIYGIPRSTLRNKVYKMGRDRSRPYFRQKGAAAKGDEEAEDSGIPPHAGGDAGVLSHALTMSGGDVMANAGGKSMLLPVLPLPLSALAGGAGGGSGLLLGDGGGAESEVEESKGEDGEDMSHEKRVLKEWLHSKLSRQAVLAPPNLSSEHAQGGARALSNVDPLSDSSDTSDVSRQDLRRDVILKIPSLLNKSSLNRVISRKKPKRKSPKELEDMPEAEYPLRNANSGGDSACTVTMGEMGAEDSAPWGLMKNEEEGAESGEEMETEVSYSGLGRRNHAAMMYERKEPMASSSAQGSASNNSVASTVTDANGKKSRPKRGKYRNYDRDALLKAVRAVQNGEMSVHRAGSFYGVPHSTLEYKVKERHLLRRPKRKGATSPKQPSHKSSPESSMSGSEPPASRLLAASAQVLESNHLPLTPDLRESLSRYLNIGQGMNMYSSAASSPDPTPRPSSAVKKNSFSEGKGRDYRLDNHAMGLGRTMSNPFLNLFHLDDLIRHNLDNDSLLDLTKKS